MNDLSQDASADYYTSFSCFGSEVRLYIGAPISDQAPPTQLAALGIQTFLQSIENKLSRFRPESELSRMNGDPAETVPASVLLRVCVKAAQAAGQHSGGLVDCTVLPELEKAGYKDSRASAQPASLEAALAQAPPRQPARPSPSSNWSKFVVNDDTGTITRPVGLRVDSGGVGKGLAADLAAERLKSYGRAIVDCGGDLRIRSSESLAPMQPYEIDVQHPIYDEVITSFSLSNGAIASSGLSTRIWQTGEGFNHHLIDPASGKPAWTGVIQSTALAPTALEAETISKTALLLGPQRARELLSSFGGVLVLDDGSSERFASVLETKPAKVAV